MLHLVDDVPATLARLYTLLRPGGVLIASTACISGGLTPWVLPIGAALGVLPSLQFMTRDALLDALANAGFSSIESFVPGEEVSVFTVARR